MRNFLFLLPLFFINILVADDAVFTKSAKAKVKYERYNAANHTAIEGHLKGRLENDLCWGDAHLKFSLADVNNSKQALGVELERMLVGAYLYKAWDSEFAIEGGRTKMDALFNSKLQFGSCFNGIHCSYRKGNMRIRAGENLVSGSLQRCALVGEISYRASYGPDITLAYSFTDWLSDPMYVISQVSAMYTVMSVLEKPVSLYGAFVKNHMITNHSNGMYVGAVLGSVSKAKDWMIDINWQYTGAYVIPAFDYHGVGTGIQIKGGYGLTDHVSFQAKVVLAAISRAELCGIYTW